jgi:hypothetical protein
VRAAFRPLLWLGALAGTGNVPFRERGHRAHLRRRDFAPAAVILQVFAPGLLLLFIDILLGNIIYACGGDAAASRSRRSPACVVGTALDLLLIPLVPAALGTTGSACRGLRPERVRRLCRRLDRDAAGHAGAGDGPRRRPRPRRGGRDRAPLPRASAVPPWAGIPLCVATFAAASLAVQLVSWEDLSVLPRCSAAEEADVVSAPSER